MTHDVSLVTNLLQMPSLPVLEDWFDFLPYPPKTLICFTGGDPEIEEALRALCAERGTELIVPPAGLTENIRHDDLPVIKWQLKNAPDPYCLRVSLDTIPYRTDDFDWLNYCVETMESDGLLYTTGSCKAFRADRPTARDDVALTQRVSFNFILCRPSVWLDLEAQAEHMRASYGRFYIEALLEAHCRKNDQWGLRVLNVPARRVFHVQVWDERIAEIRRRFRAGDGIERFITGYEDDLVHLWDRYYMWPKSPWSRRLRIVLGKYRRRVFPDRS